MTMLEKVARALCKQYEIEEGFSEEQAERASQSEMWRNFRGAARAVIEALMEPTEGMLDAFDKIIERELGDGKSYEYEQFCKAMLTAVLEEKL